MNSKTKKKLVYISSQAVPTQIKLAVAMNEYFDSEFWFYDNIGERPSWWKIDLNSATKVLKYVLFKKNARYLTFQHLFLLRKNRPDILMLGGFSIPSNYLAYLWAKFYKIKVVVFTERSRDSQGKLRQRSLIWRIIKIAYNNLDLILVSADDIVDQFVNTFRFRESQVIASQYAADIGSYLQHEKKQQQEIFRILFPNKLIPIYNPIGAIEIVGKLIQKHPKIHLTLNADGLLRKQCEVLITQLKIERNVTFLDEIRSWDELNLIYKSNDIMFLPALFSNGNFSQLEAMASGMGIVISENVLGVGKLIVNGVNGFVCGNNDDEYIYSIECYLKNFRLVNRHGELNKMKVRDFSIESTAKLYFDQLSKLLE